MVKQLYIDGVGSGDYQIFINSDTYLNSPTLDFEEYQIPAVNGNLIAFNGRLNNIIRKFDCYIRTDVLDNLNDFKKLIYSHTGYMRIESDYDPDTFQYGYLAQDIEVTPFTTGRSLEVNFTLYFSCKPQKWFKENTEVSKAVTQGSVVFMGTFPRSDAFIKGALDKLPVDAQPNDKYYAVFLLDSNLSAQTITNVSASNSSGFVYVFRRSTPSALTAIYDAVCYGNGTASNSSYTFSDNSTYLYVMIPISPDSQITTSATTSNGNRSVSYDTADNSLTASNTDAFGMDMLYKLDYQMDSSSLVVSNPVSLECFLNGQKTGEAIILVHFEEMAASQIQTLTDDYSTYGIVSVEIDSDFNAEAVKGTNRMNITSFVEILGNIDGRCDSVTATFYKSSNNAGTTYGGTLKPQWWKL